MKTFDSCYYRFDIPKRAGYIPRLVGIRKRRLRADG
jgi:hypothetical protein